VHCSHSPTGRRVATILAIAAVAMSVLSSALVWVDVATLRPCPPNYVNLFGDVFAILLATLASIAFLLLTPINLAVLWKARRGDRFVLLSSVGAISLLLTLVCALPFIHGVINHLGETYDPHCWTF
jgi:hypothetical protein